MQHTIKFSPDLIQRYDKSGPRYTSYPTAVEFHHDFTEKDYMEQTALSDVRGGNLSLYYHIPFCDTICFFCACNKIATKNRSMSEPYLAAMYKEIEMQAKFFNHKRIVDQLHFGGGTPTFLSAKQMEGLIAHTAKYFTLRDDDQGEYSIEIDPREADRTTIKSLREMGFNRLSLGVQDFNASVQQAINRAQSLEITQAVIEAAREFDFHSVSVDLIYGLPLQTVNHFMQTLETVISLSPNRISVFNYAHLPETFKPQRRINEDELPSASEKLKILQQTIKHLTEAGYVYIGMDHFAKPDDPLATAQQTGHLHRTFQGYSTHAECDLIGFGVSSIGLVNHCYSQNVKDLDRYYAMIEADKLPIERGIVFDDEDVLRRYLIADLMCNFSVNYAAFKKQYDIDFETHFANEIVVLKSMEKDGLLTFSKGGFEVKPEGRLLIRNVAMVFDKYLRRLSHQRFSRTI